MIEPFHSQFLNPTKKFRRLSVLLAIQGNPRVSQHQIGRITHLSSSMVNNYIKDFQKEALIKVSGRTNRTQSYHLTEAGREELFSLLLAYSAEIIQLYGSTKKELSERLDHLQEEGIYSIALFGAAETAEVFHAALKDRPLDVRGIVDSDPRKQGTPFNGFTIQPPEALKQMNADAVVITSFAKQEEIYHRIFDILGKGVRVKKLSDL
jgi:DNA-binding MarR family transcriptional regulator